VTDGDRRKFARETCLLSAWLRDGSRLQEGTILNIAEDGAYLATRAFAEVGQTLQLRFRHPWSEDQVTARVQVVRRVAHGSSGGPQQGLALQLLDTLSHLEESPSSASGPNPALQSSPDLRRDAAEAFSFAAARSSRPPGPKRPPRILTPGLRVSYAAGGKQEGSGTLVNANRGGLAIACPLPPGAGRLVRLELEAEAGAPPLRLAAKIVWASAEPDGGRPAGFGVSILHFLSHGHEKRFEAFLQRLQRDGGPGAVRT
jgi:hypothetical protein